MVFADAIDCGMGGDFGKWETGVEMTIIRWDDAHLKWGFECGIVGRSHSEKCVYKKSLTMNSCSGICPRLEKIPGVLVGRTSSPLPVTALRRD